MANEYPQSHRRVAMLLRQTRGKIFDGKQLNVIDYAALDAAVSFLEEPLAISVLAKEILRRVSGDDD